MSPLRKILFVLSVVLSFFAAPAIAGQADDGTKRLAIQISDNDPATFNKALNVATNFARGMSESGDFYEIEIVTFNAGLHMLRADTSPVLDRIQSISESIPEVTFSACGNTIAGMTRKEGAEPPITEHAGVVTAGVVRLMELDDEGYFIIRP
jgi:intracellular sulfur oxidation DsrE/DsrF family protein